MACCAAAVPHFYQLTRQAQYQLSAAYRQHPLDCHHNRASPLTQRRDAQKERREELGVQEDLDSFDIKARAREEAKAKADELVQVDFEDGHTQAMFGDTVTVTTMVGIPDSDDEDAIETARLEKELLEEKKRARAERLAGSGGRWGRGCGGAGGARGPGRGGGRGGGVAGGSEGAKEERWSLAAVSKRLAANMPAKQRKAAGKRGTNPAVATTDKGKKGGKKGKRGGAGGARGGGAASALMDKARGSMPRAELGKGKKRKR